MTELAVAAFAAETGSHTSGGATVSAVREVRPRVRRNSAYLVAIESRGIRWLPRPAAPFPRGLAAIFDPAGRLVRSRRRRCGAARAARGRSRRRPLLLAVRLLRFANARPRACRRRSRSRQRPGARSRRRGASWRTRSGGRTIAVLGCGVDRVYPAAHAELARRVAERGLIVSEYAPGVEPAPWRFPAGTGSSRAWRPPLWWSRQRASGALITADPIEEGREVFAVPGEIT